MSRSKRRSPVPGFLLFLLFCAAGAGLWIAGKPRLKARFKTHIENMMSRTLGARCTVKDVRAGLSSIYLEQIRVVYPLHPAGSVRIDAPEAAVGINPLTAAQRAVHLLRSGSTLDSLLTIGTLTAVSIDNAVIGVTIAGSASVRLQGVDIHAGLGKEPVQGTVRADTIITGGALDLGRLSARFEIKDDRIAISRSSARILGASAKGVMSICTRTAQVYACTVRAMGVDLARAYALSPKVQGSLTGKADARFIPLTPWLPGAALQGKGRLSAANVVADGTPIQKTLILSLLLPGLSRTEFDRITADVRIQEAGRITIDSLWGSGNPLEIRLRGWIDTSGRTDLRLEGILTREFTRTLGKVVAGSLDQMPDGRRRFACRIRGSVENPRVELEGGLMRRAISKAFEGFRGDFERGKR